MFAVTPPSTWSSSSIMRNGNAAKFRLTRYDIVNAIRVCPTQRMPCFSNQVEGSDSVVKIGGVDEQEATIGPTRRCDGSFPAEMTAHFAFQSGYFGEGNIVRQKIQPPRGFTIGTRVAIEFRD